MKQHKREGRQSFALAIIIIAGLAISYVLTSEAVRLAKHDAFSSYESKVERYVSSLSRHISSGETAARDLYLFFKTGGEFELDKFLHHVNTNSYINGNRVFVGLTIAVNENSEIRFLNFISSFYGDDYNIRIPESLEQSIDNQIEREYRYPLFFSWLPDQHHAKHYDGLDLSFSPEIYNFLNTAKDLGNASAIVLPSIPELDGGREGLILLAFPYEGKDKQIGLFLQILDFEKIISDEAQKQNILYDGFGLSVSTSWNKGAYHTLYQKQVIEELTPPSSLEFLYDEASLSYTQRFGAADWQFHIRASSDAVKPDLGVAYITLSVCLLLTALFYTISYLQGQRAIRVSEIVERRTRALKEAHDELEEHYRLLQNLNKDVEEARKAAEAANKAKSEFLATMSHELRTPLNAILGFSQLLSEEALGKIGDPRYTDYARDIYSSGSHLLGVINDILDLAKLEAGKIEIEHKPLRLKPIVDRACSLVEQQVEVKKLEMVRDISPELPDMIMGDELRLRQILINLCTNAVKFTHKGSVTIRLLPKHFRDGRAGWVMEVEDTGIGIPDDKQVNLFDRFTQVDTTLARRHGGVGLGLAICRELVDRMQGTISVRSMPGVGTTFRVHLPLEVSNDDGIADDNLI